MKRGDTSFLRQLINSLEASEPKLKRAYEMKDSEEFNKIKSFMLRIQKQIEQIIKK